SAVLLGYSDGYVDDKDLEELDAYQTRIGGLPTWLDDAQKPDPTVMHCGGCNRQMRLLVQVYVPLDHRPHERVLYVWGCNHRRCMREQGCFRV
ncbi:hypothetical protein THASP1DRAFT_2631, partial [Thamnocephalis sphaerospora]